MWELRGPRPKTLAMAGVHYPTFLMTNFRDPPVRIPPEVRRRGRRGGGKDGAHLHLFVRGPDLAYSTPNDT